MRPEDISESADAQELAWVHAAQAGDRVAFGKLAQLYQRRCAAAAIRILGNTHDAADLVQDALMKAYRRLSQLKELDRFGPWLIRIVNNSALNFRHSRARRKAISLEQVTSDGDDLRSTLSGGVNDAPDRPMSSAELGAAISKAIADLPEKQRRALVMYAIEKMPQKDVAEILNCSVETVRWRVFVARKILKKALDPYLQE